ncbi:MAG: hypothetical protein Q8P67_14760, partial [archaeon]|nr:hypothetical protein [archaeon]
MDRSSSRPHGDPERSGFPSRYPPGQQNPNDRPESRNRHSRSPDYRPSKRQRESTGEDAFYSDQPPLTHPHPHSGAPVPAPACYSGSTHPSRVSQVSSDPYGGGNGGSQWGDRPNHRQPPPDGAWGYPPPPAHPPRQSFDRQSTTSSSFDNSRPPFDRQYDRQYDRQFDRQFEGRPHFDRRERRHDELQIDESRRLFIGNLPPSATADQVIMLFNDAMRHANVWDGAHPPPVSQCHLPPGKGFAFITFLRAEDATAALVFNGISFSYRNLRVGRPQNYQGPADTPKQAGVGGGTGTGTGGGGGVAGVSAHVPDSPNKLFLGGLPNTMSETDVLGMLTPFGTLKAFHLVMDPGTGMFKGFGFCEFEDPALSDTVCQALNGQKLGDKILIVQ